MSKKLKKNPVKCYFNIKKLIPLGKIGSYAAALFLIKEHANLTDEQLHDIFDKADIDYQEDLSESTIYTTDFEELKPGTYTLKNIIGHSITGEEIFQKGTKIRVEDFTIPVGKVFDINIFEGKHIATGQDIYISEYDIER